eukprot:scaffold120273_cov22-Tisochrysis_lutea.AAC.1
MHAGTRTQTQGAEKSCPWCAAFHVPSWAWVMLEGAVVKQCLVVGHGPNPGDPGFCCQTNGVTPKMSDRGARGASKPSNYPKRLPSLSSLYQHTHMTKENEKESSCNHREDFAGWVI